jgi:hypothetical protein
MKDSCNGAIGDWVATSRSALLLAVGIAGGFGLGTLVMNPDSTHAAARQRYKVEQMSMGARQAEALQELLEKRADEGWLLQALDHETMIFRRAAAPRSTPSPPPEQ